MSNGDNYVIKSVDKNAYKTEHQVMAAATVRISPKGHAMLRSLASAEGGSMAETLDHALETYRRQKFLETAGAAYENLRHDSRAWKKHQTEMAEWESTLGDGLKGR